VEIYNYQDIILVLKGVVFEQVAGFRRGGWMSLDNYLSAPPSHKVQQVQMRKQKKNKKRRDHRSSCAEDLSSSQLLSPQPHMVLLHQELRS